MKNNIIKSIDKFISSENKSCLVIGTDIQKKHLNILKYLNSLNKKLRILIRINSMQQCEQILGYKVKTGQVRSVANLNIYVDSFNSKSQDTTPRKFNCIIVYPIDGLKGVSDNNIIDILNFRESEKIFWVSSNDTIDYNYLKQICDIEHTLIMNNEDEIIHGRVLENTSIIKRDTFDRISVASLSYYNIEEAIDKKYNLGGIFTSSMSHEPLPGSFSEYTFGGNKSTKRFSVKVLETKVNDEYVLLIKQI